MKRLWNLWIWISGSWVKSQVGSLKGMSWAAKKQDYPFLITQHEGKNDNFVRRYLTLKEIPLFGKHFESGYADWLRNQELEEKLC